MLLGYDQIYTFDPENFLSEIINLYETHIWIIPSLFLP